ncbi:hypothetical protein ACFQ08_36440 [Streptosporangium algeriense]|uniref:Uncharacterized protein n=1 Tax=Streptosporangium algeriense TaxID=1682748 RepID=A0ABW3E587_9ACTN
MVHRSEKAHFPGMGSMDQSWLPESQRVSQPHHISRVFSPEGVPLS